MSSPSVRCRDFEKQCLKVPLFIFIMGHLPDTIPSMLKILQQHPQWSHVVGICSRLQAQGHSAVLAGGCVRDALMGRLAKDMDVATSATPEQIEKIFEKVVMVGQSFGVCRIVDSSPDGQGQEPIEVATFREESDYKDGRRPEQVVFSTLQKDALRRDFTINAMFYDLQTQQVIDVVGGQKDLNNRILRTVGEPEERFQEDSLRLLRAARFAAQLDLTVEPKTLQAVQNRAAELSRVSRERWQDEINKAFQIQRPFLFFKNLQSMKLAEVLWSGWMWDQKALDSFFAGACEGRWGWAAMIFLQTNFSKKQATEKLSEFKLSNEKILFVKLCISAEDFLFSSDFDIKKWVQLMKEPQMSSVIDFWKRMSVALQRSDPSEKWALLLKRYCPSGVLPVPQINGDDLKAQGVKPGPAFGELMEKSYIEQIQNPSWSKEKIISIVLKK